VRVDARHRPRKQIGGLEAGLRLLDERMAAIPEQLRNAVDLAKPSYSLRPANKSVMWKAVKRRLPYGSTVRCHCRLNFA